MIILQEAARATDIAEILQRFLPYERDRRLPEAIGQLENLVVILRSLARLIEAQNNLVEPIFRDDLELLQHSVAYTLQDVWIILGRLPEQLIGHDYRDAWKQISDNCKTRHSDSLAQRIRTYSNFAAALCRILRRERVPLSDLRNDIQGLRRDQLRNRRLITAADAINELSNLRITQALPPPSPGSMPPPPAPAPIRQPRSAERVRPTDVRTMSPTDSSTSKEFPRPPPAPQPPPPNSPPTSSTTASQASSNDIESQHWIASAFRDLPATAIPEDPESSKETNRCFPLDQRDGEPWPGDDFERILKMIFPGRFKFMYYFRERDNRAKVLCEWPDGRSRSAYACLPLTDLHSRRQGSCLHLCRPMAGVGGSVRWASLKFTHIEFLIIFHCSFLSLRSHDTYQRRQSQPERDVFDRELKGEDGLFAASIRDNGYRHCLRIHREKSTNALRLAASVLEGEMRDTPIWTAFITHHVTSPRWLTRHPNPDRGTVYLADLKRHIFSSAYEPHVAASGQHVLDFDQPGDAIAFESTIARIGARYRQLPRRSTSY